MPVEIAIAYSGYIRPLEQAAIVAGCIGMYESLSNVDVRVTVRADNTSAIVGRKGTYCVGDAKVHGSTAGHR